MLRTRDGNAVRFSNPDHLQSYMGGKGREAASLPILSAGEVDRISPAEALEETLFLGLRMNDGLQLSDLYRSFGHRAVDALAPAIHEAVTDGLLTHAADNIRLTPRGRAISNELFSRLLTPTTEAATPSSVFSTEAQRGGEPAVFA
jgi:oxygen-independent coproporphyrinogen-3 oxidase